MALLLAVQTELICSELMFSSNIYTSEFYPEVLKFSRLVIHILWLSCDDQPCSYFRRLNIDPEWLYQDNFSLFWWFWWMKPRMRYLLVIGLLPFKAALPNLQGKLFTCWNRPALPWFNFIKIICVSNSLCATMITYGNRPLNGCLRFSLMMQFRCICK